MFRSFYKINLSNLGLENNALRYKIELEQAVNKVIFDFYYNKNGDFRKFSKELEVIKEAFSLTLINTFQKRQIINAFAKDIKHFQNYFKELERVNKNFSIKTNFNNAKKFSIKPNNSSISQLSYFKKSNLNNGGY